MAALHSHICKGSRVLLTLFVVCLFILWTLAETGPTHGKVVVCYISAWAVYRPGHGSYSIDNFEPNLCTHVIHAFAGLDATKSAIKSLDPEDLNKDSGKGAYERLTSIKRTHPHLKVSLAIGGWNEGTKNYSTLIADPKLRGKFVKQVTSFIRKHNFDGLDLHWKYPTQRGGDLSDRENFILLAKELRAAFDPHNLLLTAAIAAVKHIIDAAYNVRQISRYLDYLHVMSFDFHGSWENKIGFNAPLVDDSGDIFSVQFTLDYLLKLGAPPEKLVLGLPFYGRSYKTPHAANIGDDTDGKSFQGPYTQEIGFLGYNEICIMLSNKTVGWTTEWDAKTWQVIARSRRDVSDGLVSVFTYDSSRSIANKVKFAIQKQLGGLMIWSIDTDDFMGECTPDEDTYVDYKFYKRSASQGISSNYPLLRTINDAITLARKELKHNGNGGNGGQLIL